MTQATVAPGIGELHAHRRGQAEAHRAEAARVDPAARLVELVVLRGPHLVLADVGRDERVAARQLVELLDHELRLDELARAVVAQAILALPFLDLGPPRLQRRRIRPRGRRFDELHHLGQHVAHVADDRHVDLHALGDRRRVDVDVDDLAVGAVEMRRIADDAIVEARADGEQHVAVLHRHVRLVGAVHAEHAGELRVGAREAAEPHQRVRARKAEQAHEPRERVRRVVEDDAAARVDHRPLRLEQQLHGLLIWPAWPFVTGLYERSDTDFG